MRAGLLVVGGVAAGATIPHDSVVIAGFLLGFTYHDTLSEFRRLSRNLFSKQEKVDEINYIEKLVQLHDLKKKGIIENKIYLEKRIEIFETFVSLEKNDPIKTIERCHALLEKGVITKTQFKKKSEDILEEL